ncbi:MAG: hypothetical protein AAB727_03025 [Patescibacteria group bacterium]
MQKITSFILAEAPRLKSGTVLETPQSESAPNYFGASIPKQIHIAKEDGEVDGRKVTFLIRAYRPDILVVEAEIEVDDIFSGDTFDTRFKLIDACKQVVKRHGGKLEMSEEYSVAVFAGYTGEPEQFFEHGRRISSFLKSEKLPLDEKEVEYTMSFQLKYAKDDLVIVDWDGAFIFDPDGEYESITELLRIANLQLLRYRILDRDLGERLGRIEKIVQSQVGKSTLFPNRELAAAFRNIIVVRSRSIEDFEAVDRDIRLIGEWYSARLFDLAARKFKFDEWKQHIKERLDSLEDVYSIVSENFSLSRRQVAEYVQMFLFFVLQVLWFALIILEFLYFTR